ncbi:DNA-binding protein [Desulfosarcina alkanivorans]|uniref:RNA-binding protein KhpB n=1 Tax=Desulfosarcina alkanivorans TaxID=571177 RepID=A0A5K7YKG2_9BACT|nr:RNA-binding cell elongation regulator Jag/EloR [Desulfosarcina alkanivorans]BBO70202.1 DNA-binding protein [Desulfosarcina alkanivorans]
MSKTLEFKGKNVDQALANASDELNLPVDRIKHEVLAYGSSGIFGLVGVKKAIIKVFIDDAAGGSRSKTDEKKKHDSSEKNEDFVQPPHEAGEVSGNDDELVAGGILALQKIIDAITSGATVNLDRQKERLYFTISGGDSGVLIGKRGQTLEAIQYLLEKMINKKSTNRIRVVVDVEGYLEKRKDNLQQMASRMAEKAKRTKKPVTIGQMNAHDRRIVHIHLKDDKGVRTQSLGDGYFRKLMIFPKKQSGAKKKNHK